MTIPKSYSVWLHLYSIHEMIILYKWRQNYWLSGVNKWGCQGKWCGIKVNLRDPLGHRIVQHHSMTASQEQAIHSNPAISLHLPVDLLLLRSKRSKCWSLGCFFCFFFFLICCVFVLHPDIHLGIFINLSYMLHLSYSTPLPSLSYPLIFSTSHLPINLRGLPF